MESTLTEQPVARARAVRLHPSDDVVIAMGELPAGTALEGEGVRLRQVVPAGHKVATRAIPAGAPVHKYNQIIGFATQPIAPGDHVHVHNLGMHDFERDYAFCAGRREPPARKHAVFQGIVRSDGRVATRNYLGIISTVNCSATVARKIADVLSRTKLADYPHVDGVVPITHTTGCGMSDRGEGMEILRRTLTGYARHVNFAGILVIGLGCEVNQVDALVEVGKLAPGPMLASMTIQDAGGTVGAVREGVARLEAMLPQANEARRQPVSVEHLCVGLQCGGSDGYSGISANPALGAAVDLLVAHGGTAILSETPEIYGAEHLLTRRANAREVGEKLVNRIRWWEEYTARNRAEMNNNPSPGNKAGGLTTILEKSLGAVAKGGTTNLMAVYEYAEPVTGHGLIFMDTPGYDPVSATGQVAGGANLICFTTGRGSVYGCKPAPSIKLATNSALYARMQDDVDVNCGELLDGKVSLPELGGRIFSAMVATASGQPSRSEAHGFGVDEFVPWALGAVM
ncbi:MAG: altronate dehydratase [Verrucomicrobia bacterium]|nr:altronate dehydratase [Verrucomicrobiota bacterium]